MFFACVGFVNVSLDAMLFLALIMDTAQLLFFLVFFFCLLVFVLAELRS